MRLNTSGTYTNGTPQSDRSHETGKYLQVAVACEEQRPQTAVVIGVREPHYAVFGPELGMENCVRAAQNEQSACHTDGEGPK